MRRLLLIDDDRAPLRYYIKALSDSGFVVTHVRNPDEALQCLRNGDGPEFAAIVMDIMMPPGTAYGAQNTEDGILTGEFLFKDVRQLRPKTPMLILTNLGSVNWLGEVDSLQGVRIVRKINCDPFELVETVSEMINVQKNSDWNDMWVD